ncbi:MAG: hypothetical protein HOO94_07325 [Novosphingobium sp.]|uniref:hypothetical protein n=1 Tax=Novosphingobium sp. TaxID=1874826 RepID=UPI00183A62B1|nr:hypothetical protein [Novosphingobium sp.]
MNRILLALLALFTGLVAPVAPAQARMGGAGSAEVGAVESLALAAKACSAAAVVNETPACRTERCSKATGRVRPQRPRVFIPTVLFGADRAFE